MSLLDRIAKALREGDPLDVLTNGLSPSDLQSLMMHVYRTRSAVRTPADLLSQYCRSPLVGPSNVSARELRALEALAFECAETFEAVDLSPVAPLGVNKVLGEIDQNSCLATIRNCEVLADPTSAMALECAKRRRAGETNMISLCARGRMVRLQPFDQPGFTPHFDIFALVTAARDHGNLDFEFQSLRAHLEAHITMLCALEKLNYRASNIDVAIADTTRSADRLQRVRTAVLDPLSKKFPAVTFRIDETREQGLNYYSGLCLRIDAHNNEGKRLNLGDGGFTNWTQRFLSNSKERLLTSAIGLELIPRLFRAN